MDEELFKPVLRKLYHLKENNFKLSSDRRNSLFSELIKELFIAIPSMDKFEFAIDKSGVAYFRSLNEQSFHEEGEALKSLLFEVGISRKELLFLINIIENFSGIYTPPIHTILKYKRGDFFKPLPQK